LRFLKKSHVTKKVIIAAPIIEATIAPPSSPAETMSPFVLGLDVDVPLAVAAVCVVLREVTPVGLELVETDCDGVVEGL
jgi:hypothetical protein